MTEYFAEHWILSIVVTIVLGAVGSGLWEAALKPLMRKTSSLLFTLLTFGARRARDGVYKDAAMGHHELPSLYILLIVLLLSITTIMASQVRFYVAVYAPQVSDLLLEKCQQEKEQTKQKECIREVIKQNFMPVMQVTSLFAIFMSVFIFYRFMMINRINLVITNYEQCLKAVRPFLAESESMLIEQRYALMTTKEDYLAIICDLEAVAKNNNTVLPAAYL